MAKIVEVTNPVTGQPTQVDQLDHTAQQIDDAISRALPGGYYDKWVSQLPGQNLLDNSVFIDGCLVDQRQGRVVIPNTTYYSDNKLTTAAGTTSAYVTAYRYATGTASGVNYASFKLEDSDTAPTYYASPANVVRGYTGAGYGPDRWQAIYGGETVLIKEDCVLFILGGNQGVKQIVDAAKRFAGKTVTMSILWGLSGNYANMYATCNGRTAAEINRALSFSKTCDFTTFTIPTDCTDFFISIHGDGELGMYAVKLELGSHQTLAHQENGVWVLNEIPDYGEQLARCQRYRIPYGKFAQWGAVDIKTDYIDFSVYLPVTMRTKPSIEGASNLVVSGHTDFAFSVAVCNGNNLRVRATKSNHGLTNAMLEALGDFAFVAEL